MILKYFLCSQKLLDPADVDLIPNIPDKISEEKNKSNNAEVNHWHWFEESVQWLKNVDRINLVLASGKPVLQKIC